MGESRVIPKNIEAEQAVLGAVLEGERVPTLSAGDFYKPGHGVIFEAMLNLEAKQEPVDYLTVKAELERVGKLQEAGGISYVSSLTEQVPPTSHIDRYAEEVREKASLRKIISECRRISDLALDPGMSCRDVLDQFQVAALGMNGNTPYGSSVRETVRESLKEIEAAYKTKPERLGIPTGFRELDRVTLGWQAPDLIVIAARPGQGKTALGLDVGREAARNGLKVFFCSLEMSVEQLTMRLLSRETGIDSRSLRLGRFNQDQWGLITAAAGQITELDITIDDTAAISELELARRVRREKPALLVVDYLQLMQSGRRGERRDLEIGNITAGLKAIAKELHVPVILLSQLNREAEKRANPRPKLSDLRESGAIEQDADLVLGIYRDLEKTPQLAELICLKHRNGPLGTIELAFREELTSFADLPGDGD